MKDKIINPKSFVLLKYLFTIGLFLAEIIFIFSYLKLQKDSKEFEQFFNSNSYFIIQYLLFVCSIIFLLLYLYFRIKLRKIIKYTYKKSEKIVLYFTILLILIILIFSFISIFTYNFNNIKQKTFIISILTISLINAIVCSILEVILRLEEQSIVNQKWFDTNNTKETKKQIDQNLETNYEKIKKDDNKKVNPFEESGE